MRINVRRDARYVAPDQYSDFYDIRFSTIATVFKCDVKIIIKNIIGLSTEDEIDCIPLMSDGYKKYYKQVLKEMKDAGEID